MVIIQHKKRRSSGPPPRKRGADFLYQKNRQYFAQIASGLEEAGADEISKLGAGEVQPAIRGIYFRASGAALYRINYHARLISRVLAPLVSFQCLDTDVLYHRAKGLPWEKFLKTNETFAVFANVSKSRIDHSHYASLRLKDAVADRFRERFGSRPSVDTAEPDIWIHLHILENRATISMDTSGGSLHRRGYRKDTVATPMQETLGAAVIRFSEWDGTRPLADPMCGSGTLLAEALMHYCRIPAGYLRRRFGFEKLPDFAPDQWKSVTGRAGSQMREVPAGLITGSDISHWAVKAARKNINVLPSGGAVRIGKADFDAIDSLENTVIVTNPPYGIRTGRDEDMGGLMKRFGDFLKQRCRGASAFIYFGDRELIKRIGLKPTWKKPLSNGGLDGRLVRYDLY